PDLLCRSLCRADARRRRQGGGADDRPHRTCRAGRPRNWRLVGDSRGNRAESALMALTHAEAVAADKADPLRPLRNRFHLPEGLIYLDGNSLGALPLATIERQQDAVRREWGETLIRSCNVH